MGKIDKILICVIIITIFVTLFLCVKYIPIWIIKRRSNRYGVKISSEEIKELIKMGCINPDFFRLCSLFIDKKIDFNILQLAQHQISGGSLECVLSGLLYAKNNQISVSYSEICILDLAKKDVLETLKKGQPYL